MSLLATCWESSVWVQTVLCKWIDQFLNAHENQAEILRSDSRPSLTHVYSIFRMKGVHSHTQRCKIPGLCCKNLRFSRCLLHWVNAAGWDSTTLVKSRSSPCKQSCHVSDLQRGGHSACYSANCNVINALWSWDCSQFSSDGEEKLPVGKQFLLSSDQERNTGPEGCSPPTHLVLVRKHQLLFTSQDGQATCWLKTPISC